MPDARRRRPGQTVGPFFHYALPVRRRRRARAARRPRTRSGCTAACTTAQATPVPDALLEIRQADADGHVPPVEGSLRRDG